MRLLTLGGTPNWKSRKSNMAVRRRIKRDSKNRRWYRWRRYTSKNPYRGVSLCWCTAGRGSCSAADASDGPPYMNLRGTRKRIILDSAMGCREIGRPTYRSWRRRARALSSTWWTEAAGPWRGSWASRPSARRRSARWVWRHRRCWVVPSRSNIPPERVQHSLVTRHKVAILNFFQTIGAGSRLRLDEFICSIQLIWISTLSSSQWWVKMNQIPRSWDFSG